MMLKVQSSKFFIFHLSAFNFKLIISSAGGYDEKNGLFD
jgi:hypothetical protein